MREKYWKLFQEMKFSEFYLWYYQLRCKRISGFLNAVCIISTTASVASWGIWGQYPIIWSIIIACAQVIAVLKPSLPFYKQLTSCKLIQSDIVVMLTRIENDWLKIEMNEYEDAQIRELIFGYKKEYNALDNRYIGDVYFPHVEYCAKKAEEECKRYFQLHFGN